MATKRQETQEEAILLKRLRLLHCNTPNSSQAARKLTGPGHEDIKTGKLKTGEYVDFHYPVFNFPVFSALGCAPAALWLLAAFRLAFAIRVSGSHFVRL